MHNVQSPRTDDEGIEAELQAKGLTAPRVTPKDIGEAIKSEHYFTAREGVLGSLGVEAEVVGPGDIPSALDVLTICVFVLWNDFTVTGESACASPENFDPEVGRKLARAKAIDKTWAFLGYGLKSAMAEAEDQEARAAIGSLMHG
jgi:hypothetical protein